MGSESEIKSRGPYDMAYLGGVSALVIKSAKRVRYCCLLITASSTYDIAQQWALPRRASGATGAPREQVRDRLQVQAQVQAQVQDSQGLSIES